MVDLRDVLFRTEAPGVGDAKAETIMTGRMRQRWTYANHTGKNCCVA